MLSAVLEVCIDGSVITGVAEAVASVGVREVFGVEAWLDDREDGELEPALDEADDARREVLGTRLEDDEDEAA